jgi:hypothetical protein
MPLSSDSRRHGLSRSIRLIGLLLGCALAGIGRAGEAALTGSAPVTFVFTSDVHYGLTRGSFRGEGNVESRVVNAAMVRKINGLPATRLPDDGGVNAGRMVGPVDFVIITGDFANRQELYPLRIQSASVSWGQFEDGFIRTLALKGPDGQASPLLLVPGNHDATNAIGAWSKMVPDTDATAMAEIYNRMMHPATPRTKETYSYSADKVYYAKDFGGVHCIFLTIWPDSVARAWMESDLKGVPATMPVLIFCHDPPDIDARHLTNPNGKHDINDRDKFENLVADVCADGPASDGPTTIEQRALAAFLKAHRNIVGYFHGHNNWNEFYTWKGPDGDLALNVFRADSPMKGKISGKDEAKLSFQVVVFDAAAQKLTARECLWNSKGASDNDSTPVAWGSSETVRIAVR